MVRSGSAASGPIPGMGLISLGCDTGKHPKPSLSTDNFLSANYFFQWSVLILVSFKGHWILDTLLRVNLDFLTSFFKNGFVFSEIPSLLEWGGNSVVF